MFWTYIETTETNRTVPKQKYQNMLSIKLFWSLFYLFRFNRNTETLCFSIEEKQPKQRICSDSAETCFGSSFGCFELKPVSKDNLLATLAPSYPFFPLYRGSIPAGGRRGGGTQERRQLKTVGLFLIIHLRVEGSVSIWANFKPSRVLLAFFSSVVILMAKGVLHSL